MGRWEKLKNEVFKRSDNLDKQIYNGKLFIQQTANDVYKDIDKTDDYDKNNELISKEARKESLAKYLKDNGYEEIDSDILLHRFVLKEDLTRKDYNKLKSIAGQSLSFILVMDHLQDELQKTFDRVFEVALVNGQEKKDLDLLEISDIMTLCQIFIQVFDARFEELKKK